jgi:hypothetical protein
MTFSSKMITQRVPVNLYEKGSRRSAILTSGRRQLMAHNSLRRFLSDQPKAVSSGQSQTSSGDVAVVQGTNSASLGTFDRHGPGDAFISLCVGGKEFYTLRSTVNSNAVLADHVARAEANKEITKDGAVFIDRDPAQFWYILQFLRNKVELISYSCQGKSCGPLSKSYIKTNYVQLPSEGKVLRDLYVEATYYCIPELQKALVSQKWVVNLASAASGTSGNPFDKASRYIETLRRSLFAAGGLFGTFTLSAQSEFQGVLRVLGLAADTNDEGTKKVNLA